MSSPIGPSPRRGVVAVITCQRRFLVIRRSLSVVAPGKYCFPGGGIEGNESEQRALVRELQEELHVQVAPQQRLWQSVTPWGIHLAWWTARLPEIPPPIPDPAEVESIHWWTAEEMLDQPELLASNRHFLDALASGEIRWEGY